MCVYGYARVSTSEQDTDIQTGWLAEQGVSPEHIYQEKRSGKSTDGREALASLLAIVKPGDVVHVYKLDRLSRNTSDCLAIANQFADQKVVLHFGDLGFVDMTSPIGEFMLTMIAAFATMERKRIVERVQAGVDAAMARGVKFGRTADTDLYGRIQDLFKQGMKKAHIARELGVSRPTIDKALK